MKPLKTNTTLQSKKPLKAKKPLSSAKKPKRQPVPEITKTKRLAWKLFSRYVRLRDSEYRLDGDQGAGWYGTCITCSKTGLIAYIDETGKLRFTSGWDAGHYIGRGNWYLRHDEENVNLQCAFRCNKMRSGEHEKYRLALDLKYGDGTGTKLDMVAAVNSDYKAPIAELRQVIHDSQEQVDWYFKESQHG